MERVKEVQYGEGAFFVDSNVADALERLAVVLSEARMSAVVRLQPPADQRAVELTLGMNQVSGRPHVVHARPFSGEPSHLGLDDI